MRPVSRSACEDHQCGGRGQRLITSCLSAIGTFGQSPGSERRWPEWRMLWKSHKGQTSVGLQPRPANLRVSNALSA
jgi:hypothetical protein